MEWYDLKNHNYKHYKYSANSKKARIINRLSIITIRIIMLIAVVMIILASDSYLKSIADDSVVLITIVIVKVFRLLELYVYNIVGKMLKRKDFRDYHDFQFYYYCKKHRKAAKTMHLMNVIYSNIIMGEYSKALEGLELVDPKEKYMENNLFNYYYYYVKVHRGLGNINKLDYYLEGFKESVKGKRLTKKLKEIIADVYEEN